MAEPSRMHRAASHRTHGQGHSHGTHSSFDDQPLSTSRRQRVRNQLVIAASVAVVVLGGTAWLGQRILTERTSALVGTYIGTLRDGAGRTVGDALVHLNETASRIAADPAAQRLLTADDGTTLANFSRVAGVDDVLLVDAQGVVVAASGGRPPVVNPEIVLRAVAVRNPAGATLPVVADRLSSQAAADPIPLVTSAAPIGAAERPRGWVLVRVAAVPLFTHLVGDMRPGTTGETYLFDATGRMLSSSRFENELRAANLLTADTSSSLHTVLRDPGDGLTPIAARPLTFLAASALRDPTVHSRGAQLAGYRDYRSQPVVGAWEWLPEHGLGIAVEMDAVEAFVALRQLQELFGILLGVLAVTLVVVLVWFRRAALLRARAHRAENRARELGQYTLLDQIGEGGMGRVYQARHRLLRRPVAIKLLQNEASSSEDIARFEREANLTALLTSPHTVRIFDFGKTSAGEFYIVMELLTGLDLTRLILDHGPQPESRVIHWLRQVCDSLIEAHAQNLIHRDLKPQNLFVCRQGARHDVVKVLDFGLAKQGKPPGIGGPVLPIEPTNNTENKLTGINQVAGTPGFMAPEQALGAAIDQRVDLYALGCVMYWLLTGTQVFPYDSGSSSIYKHLRITPDLPSTRLPSAGISAQMDALVMHLLAKEPRDRITSAIELSQRLDALPLAHAWTSDSAQIWWSAHETARQQPAKVLAPEAVSGYIDAQRSI